MKFLQVDDCDLDKLNNIIFQNKLTAMESLAFQNWAITLKPREEIMLSLDKPPITAVKQNETSLVVE